ncbi:MAG: hypothetical protein RL333_2138 [Pseudomonadota bacterium]|jgi:hypothetical protein
MRPPIGGDVIGLRWNEMPQGVGWDKNPCQ